MKYIVILFSIIVLMLTLISCNEEDNDLVGPSVTADEAEKIAKENFNITTINSVALRHLSDEELDAIPYEEAKDITPVYFIIKGIDKNQEEIIVFVNSNEKRFNYINH
ncbi:hypothetical protein [Bacillus sp. RS11]|uniref:hypothetical protein n=1 Tax=Lysinibacillus sp. RS11 TaxID=3242682 RepID=UPI0035C77CE5